MNTKLNRANEAVGELHLVISGLATAPVTEATTLCQVQPDNDRFLSVVNNAQLSIEAAQDEVETAAAIGALDEALHQVRLAREAYYKPMASNRADTLNNVVAAQREMTKAVASR